MTLLNVSFGIYAFLPQGWLFMAFVILSECLVATNLFTGKWTRDRKIFLSITGSNLISGLLGIIVTMALNGGWYLVVWFPWVISHEIDLSLDNERSGLVVFYLVCLVLTLIIETVTNILFLRRQYSIKEIIRTTVLANLVTYFVGSLVLYSYSFR